MPITSGQRNKKTKRGRKELRFIPLGGMGEIGKNISLLEYGNDILVIDSGLKFPDEDYARHRLRHAVSAICWKTKIRSAANPHSRPRRPHRVAPFLLPQIDVPIWHSPDIWGL